MDFARKTTLRLRYAEIAGRLGVPVRTIDRYMARAWEHLRGQFGRGYEG